MWCRRSARRASTWVCAMPPTLRGLRARPSHQARIPAHPTCSRVTTAPGVPTPEPLARWAPPHPAARPDGTRGRPRTGRRHPRDNAQKHASSHSHVTHVISVWWFARNVTVGLPLFQPGSHSRPGVDCRCEQHPLDDLQRAGSRLVRAHVRAADPRPALGWPAIAAGSHTLILAPTGSGKTLAAFLAAHRPACVRDRRRATARRVLYVSPLKALTNDIERNLRAPLAGIAACRAAGAVHGSRSRSARATRRQRERARDAPPPARHPDHHARVAVPDADLAAPATMLRRVETVIVDEIHAVAGTKRGAHLALSLERLEQLGRPRRPAHRPVGHQRPLEEVARFLGGDRPRGRDRRRRRARKQLDLRVVVPVEDMRELGRRAGGRGRAAPVDLAGRSTRGCWSWCGPTARPSCSSTAAARPSGVANRLNELAESRDRPRPPRLDRPRAAAARSRTCSRRASCRRWWPPPRWSSASTWAPSTWSSRSSRRKSVAAGLQRVGRAGHSVGDASRGRFFPKYRGDLLETAVVTRRMREGAIEQTRVPAQPAGRAGPADRRDGGDGRVASVDDLHALSCGRAYPYRDLSRAAVRGRAGHAGRPLPVRRVRRAAAADRLGPHRRHVRGRDGARRLAVITGGTIPDRGLYGVFLADGGARVGELDEEMVYEAAPGRGVPAGRDLLADRADHARPGAGLAGAGRARARCRSGRATASAGRPSWGRRSGDGRAHPPRSGAAGRAGRPQPDHLPGRPGGPPAWCPPTARS